MESVEQGREESRVTGERSQEEKPSKRQVSLVWNRLTHAIDRSTIGARAIVRTTFMELTPGRPTSVKKEEVMNESESGGHKLPVWHFWPWLEMALHEVENRLRPMRSSERAAKAAAHA